MKSAKAGTLALVALTSFNATGDFLEDARPSTTTQQTH
jgi:hypothetical protein